MRILRHVGLEYREDSDETAAHTTIRHRSPMGGAAEKRAGGSQCRGLRKSRFASCENVCRGTRADCDSRQRVRAHVLLVQQGRAPHTTRGDRDAEGPVGERRAVVLRATRVARARRPIVKRVLLLGRAAHQAATNLRSIRPAAAHHRSNLPSGATISGPRGDGSPMRTSSSASAALHDHSARHCIGVANSPKHQRRGCCIAPHGCWPGRRCTCRRSRRAALRPRRRRACAQRPAKVGLPSRGVVQDRAAPAHFHLPARPIGQTESQQEDAADEVQGSDKATRQHAQARWGRLTTAES
jgi:hypothetical protein